MSKINKNRNQSHAIELKEGKYSWCTCGESENMPFCDGAHKKEMKFRSLKFEITEPKTYTLCGCTKSNNAPFCDNTHKTI